MCRLTSLGDPRSHPQKLNLGPVQATAQNTVWTSPPLFERTRRGVCEGWPHTSGLETEENEKMLRLLRPAQSEKLDTEGWVSGTEPL